MKYFIKFILIFSSVLSVAFTQESKSIFFEKGPDNKLRFYYDYDYYLVDKNCEFKLIERVADFDISTNKFNGVFKDFDINGRTILAGEYKNGEKDGVFTAYYPDGTLKWTTSYIKNKQQGKIQYFYPDGKPMLLLLNEGNSNLIVNYWNKEGKQDVINGEGKIDITLPIKGFTEHGYTTYNVSGHFINGLPQGYWHTSFVNDDKRGRLVPMMTTIYEDGIIKARQIDEYFAPMLINFNGFTYSPIESFTNAELLQSKNCSFDEHTEFNSFISRKFMGFLEKKDDITSKDQTINLRYKIRVTKDGTAYAPTITEASKELTSSEKQTFNAMINQIHFYLPSFLENKVIDDRLTISLQIHTKGGQIIIPPVQILRENGF